jgi:homoserine/homoserine lactone efflux protein
MEGYLIFLAIASVTVLSPGPGVILTLTNAIRFGGAGAVNGILGIAFGTFIVAAISATSIGILLATSSIAFGIMKTVGAIYLIYLGIRLWRSSGISIDYLGITKRSRRRQFSEGLMLQLTNPKAVFFFMSIFPQFVDFTRPYFGQFALLVPSYSGLVIVIHLGYAYLATSARGWLVSDGGGRMVNRLGGGTFVCFGVALASANR